VKPVDRHWVVEVGWEEEGSRREGVLHRVRLS
jgi:hypothetical protein